MATKESEGVRIGPITLVTLISVLLLAVLAVLCVTTANATQTMAQRHAEATTESYQIDACGQALLAQIDAAAQGASSAADAAAAVSANLEAVKAGALEASSANDLSLDTQVNGTQIAFTVSAESGKTLTAQVTLGDSGALSVNEWKLSTTTQQADEETLWSGEQANQ